jgi:hypothetical protein
MGEGTFSKRKLDYHLILGPLFWECPYPRALPYTLKGSGREETTSTTRYYYYFCVYKILF